MQQEASLLPGLSCCAGSANQPSLHLTSVDVVTLMFLDAYASFFGGGTPVVNSVDLGRNKKTTKIVGNCPGGLL